MYKNIKTNTDKYSAQIRYENENIVDISSHMAADFHVTNGAPQVRKDVAWFASKVSPWLKAVECNIHEKKLLDEQCSLLSVTPRQ